MSIFNDNITTPIPKKVRAELEAVGCVLEVVDRVNNNIGSCRFVGVFDPFLILRNEIVCDNRDHKFKFKECFGVYCRAFIRHLYNKSKDPEKWSGEVEIVFAYVDSDNNPDRPDVVRSEVWVPVELYLYPNWKK